MKIILPDGNIKEMPEGSSAMDLAKSISARLAQSALAARVNGSLVDLNKELKDNDNVAIITFDDPEGKSVFWHSTSHLLAQAVQQLFPSAKIAIGPAIESGFYYDFDVEKPFTPEDLTAIEARMKELVSKKQEIKRSERECSELKAYFESKNEIYKLELLNDIEGTPSIYSQGDWLDLCRGPHLPNTGYVRQ